MSLLYTIVGLIWIVGGIYMHGTDGLVAIGIGAVYQCTASIINRLDNK